MSSPSSPQFCSSTARSARSRCLVPCASAPARRVRRWLRSMVARFAPCVQWGASATCRARQRAPPAQRAPSRTWSMLRGANSARRALRRTCPVRSRARNVLKAATRRQADQVIAHYARPVASRVGLASLRAATAPPASPRRPTASLAAPVGKVGPPCLASRHALRASRASLLLQARRCAATASQAGTTTQTAPRAACCAFRANRSRRPGRHRVMCVKVGCVRAFA